MTTVVPPFVGPEMGRTLVTTGVVGTKLKPAKGPELWASTLVTVISAEPTGKSGVVQSMEVVEATEQLTADATVVPLLNTTVAPSSKLVPVIVIGSPPASNPEVGETDVTVGAEKGGGVWPVARKATICITQ